MASKIEGFVLGTSGWSYREWIGPVYSKEDKSMLRAYSKIFCTVEIDSTFYRYPSKGMVMGWTRYSPEGFLFTAKLPKLITHEKKLDLKQGVEQDLQKFLDLMEPLSLSGKLGCILIQLPPKYSFDPSHLAGFFEKLPSHIRFAVEFRNLSWMKEETWKLLEKYKVAYTIVDEPLLPPETHLTTDFSYFRWHGKGERIWFDYEYPTEELQPWIPKIRAVSGKVAKVFGYFNNHYRGYAVKNALQTLQMLDELTPEQAEAKKRVEKYLADQRLAHASESTLETFVPLTEISFEKLLKFFIDAPRLKKAERIRDDELILTRTTNERIEAQIRDYHVLIDLEAKRIAHDCQDWNRVLISKKLCKHIGKLLLSLGEETAESILKEIYAHIEEWEFVQYTNQSLNPQDG